MAEINAGSSFELSNLRELELGHVCGSLESCGLPTNDAYMCRKTFRCTHPPPSVPPISQGHCWVWHHETERVQTAWLCI